MEDFLNPFLEFTQNSIVNSIGQRKIWTQWREKWYLPSNGRSYKNYGNFNLTYEEFWGWLQSTIYLNKKKWLEKSCSCQNIVSIWHVHRNRSCLILECLGKKYDASSSQHGVYFFGEVFLMQVYILTVFWIIKQHRENVMCDSKSAKGINLNIFMKKKWYFLHSYSRKAHLSYNVHPTSSLFTY